jgi:beta-lactamase class A
MIKSIFTFALLLFVATFYGQPTHLLEKEINQIIANKKADVGVAILGIEDNFSLQINGNKQYPLLSVFKFHLALAVLDKVDKGTLSLDQKITVKERDLLENTWSPFLKKYGKRDTQITMREALQWTISHSDNNICDVLIAKIGGINAINEFLNSPHLILKNNEKQMHESWDAEFVNTTTPNYTAKLLKDFFENKIVSNQATHFLYKTMVETSVGLKRIKGQLPTNTEVAHRTGSSSTNAQGLTGAINDIGIVQLPNGKHMVIVVFVHNTTE